MIQQPVRRKVKSAPRRMFAVLVIYCLNLAVVPCAMALQGAEDCSHCPAMAEMPMAHHSDPGAEAMADWGSMQAECCDLEAAVHDNPSRKLDTIPAMVTFAPRPERRPNGIFRNVNRPLDPGSHSSPRHEIFCVYLI